LDLWRAFLDRDDVQALPHDDRMALISIAVQVADDEPDVDGLLTRGSLRRVPWPDGPEDLRRRIDGVLTDAGFIRETDGGWLVLGWTEHTGNYRSGQEEFRTVRWGQRPSARRKADRARSRRASSAHRRRVADADGEQAVDRVTDHRPPDVT
jgi:hypothetical protein